MDGSIIPYPLYEHASEQETWVSQFFQKIAEASLERFSQGLPDCVRANS